MSSPEPLCGALAGFILVRFLVFWIIANRFPNHRTAWTSRPEYSYEPFTARPLKIGSYCDKNPTLPVSMQEQKPTTSRFLDALEIQHTKKQEQLADAISFASYRKEAGDNV